MKRFPTIVVVVVVCIALFFMLFFFQVRYTETAVVTRFERPVDRKIEAGLNFRMPWPFEQVHRFDRRLRSLDTPITQLATQDQTPLTVSTFATWRIDDANVFFKAVGSEAAADNRIGDLLKNAVSRVLKRHPLSDLINTESKQMKFREIEDEILESIRGDAKNNYGIVVAAVGIKRLGLPEKATEAVANRMKQDRQAVSDKLLAQGRAEASRILSNAGAVAEKIKARAEAYAKAIIGDGQAIAAKNYEVFEKHPELAAFLKRVESLEDVSNSGEMQLILDASKLEILKPLLPETSVPKAARDAGKKDQPQAPTSGGD